MSPERRSVYQDLKSYRLPKGLRGASAPYVQFWWIVQSLLFHPSPQALYGWRRFLLRCFGARIGERVLLRPTVRVTYPWKLEIGDRSWIGDHVELYTLDRIHIGKDAVISQGTYLCTGTHDHREPSFSMQTKPIVIEDQAWVAAECFVYPGVTIAYGAVAAARSVVTKDVPEAVIVAGQPAVAVGRRVPRASAVEP
jgi:putative colanic acid biosynthesis acetyltransferase WcaF